MSFGAGVVMWGRRAGARAGSTGLTGRSTRSRRHASPSRPSARRTASASDSTADQALEGGDERLERAQIAAPRGDRPRRRGPRCGSRRRRRGRLDPVGEQHARRAGLVASRETPARRPASRARRGRIQIRPQTPDSDHVGPSSSSDERRRAEQRVEGHLPARATPSGRATRRPSSRQSRSRTPSAAAPQLVAPAARARVGGRAHRGRGQPAVEVGTAVPLRSRAPSRHSARRRDRPHRTSIHADARPVRAGAPLPCAPPPPRAAAAAQPWDAGSARDPRVARLRGARDDEQRPRGDARAPRRRGHARGGDRARRGDRRRDRAAGLRRPRERLRRRAGRRRARRSTLALGAGLAGCSIEDYSGGEDPIYPLELAAERVAAAAAAAHAGPVHLVLTARAENHVHGRDDLDDTIARLQAFEEAGADVLYAPGPHRARRHPPRRRRRSARRSTCSCDPGRRRSRSSPRPASPHLGRRRLRLRSARRARRGRQRVA